MQKVDKFTIDEIEWAAWLTPVAAATATPEQLAVLDESPAQARSSPYFLTLVHDVDALRQRSRLFNIVMYAPRGLPRADRELATLVESYVNGCIYCASVHGRRFSELTKEPEVIHRIYEEGIGTELAPRRRAIVDFAAKLTTTPPTAGKDDIAALRAAGLGELEILDLIQSVAMFANANRLMQTLGEPVR
ncbi:MAG: peroxidase-related enzyme [Alphaproteobacteria bacterium]|nr:peroxidase-related enzyme [Alphaproteobacteria bacterium]